MDANQRNACLDQPAGHEQGAAKTMIAVTFADSNGFAVERERSQMAARGGPREQRRTLADFVEIARRRCGAVQQFQERRSSFETLAWDFWRRDQCGDGVERPRFAVDGKRIEPRSQKASRSAAKRQAGAAFELARGAVARRYFGDGDKGGQSAAAVAQFCNHRAKVWKVGSLRRADVVIFFRPLGRPPRQRVIDHRRVVAVRVTHRTHESIFVGHAA